jgi:hypothetical protein
MIDNAEQWGCRAGVANGSRAKSHKGDQGTHDTHHLIESSHSVTPYGVLQLRKDAQAPVGACVAYGYACRGSSRGQGTAMGGRVHSTSKGSSGEFE